MSIELQELVGVYGLQLKDKFTVKLNEWTLWEELWATEHFDGGMEVFYQRIQGVVAEDGTITNASDLRVVLETLYHLCDDEAKARYPDFERFVRQMGYGEYLEAYNLLLRIINEGVTPIKKKAEQAEAEMKRRKNLKKKRTKKKR